jgi:hypothetical protein
LIEIENPEETFGPLPADVRKRIKEIIEKDGAVYGLETPFYLLKDDIAFIRKIDAGIIKDMSIGFAAEGKEPVKNKDGETEFYDFTGDGDFMEVSFVWLGAQYGAQNRKDYNAGKPGKPEEQPPEGEDPQKSAAQNEQKNEVQAMKLNFKSLELVIETDNAEEIQEVVDAKVAEMMDREKANTDKLTETQADLEKANAELQALKDAIGDEDLEKLKEAAHARHDELVEEAVKFGSLIGLIDQEKADEKRKAFAEMTDEALKGLVLDYQKIHDSRNPGKEVITDSKEEKPVLEFMPLDSRFEAI